MPAIGHRPPPESKRHCRPRCQSLAATLGRKNWPCCTEAKAACPTRAARLLGSPPRARWPPVNEACPERDGNQLPQLSFSRASDDACARLMLLARPCTANTDVSARPHGPRRELTGARLVLARPCAAIPEARALPADPHAETRRSKLVRQRGTDEALTPASSNRPRPNLANPRCRRSRLCT